ncbi:MAG: DUF167 domain-containing protein [Alphaproteobacteria bacterium]|nr:DUF167 domain-containing protein [Alphaproteobacteria bacterium]
MTDLSKTFNVKVNPHSKQNKVIEDNGVLRVHVTTAPEHGRANEAVVELLSEYFKVPKSSISIIRGETCSNKVIRISKSLN